LSGAQAVAQDPNFFHKVFNINNAEMALYGVGSPYTSLNQVPNYSGGPVASVNSAVLSASNLAGQTIPAGAKGVKILSADFKGNGAVNKLTVNRLGFLGDSQYSQIYLAVNGKRVTDPTQFSGIDNKVATFNNLGITAPFSLDVVVDFSGSEPSGTPAQVSLSGDYTGLPLQSNQLLFASVSPPSEIGFGNVASVSNVVVGQDNAKVGEFKVSVPDNSESVSLKSVQLRNVGDADISDLKFVIDGTTYNGVSLGDDKFLVNTNVTILDGKSKKIEVFADISGNADAGDEVKLRVEKSYDVLAIGNVYGFGVKVAGVPNFDLDTVVVSSSGAITSSSVSGDKVVALWGESDVELFQFKLKATDESFTLDSFVFGGIASVSDLSVWQGSTFLGSLDGEIEDGVATVSADFVLTGEKVFTVKADIAAEEEAVSVAFTPSLTAVNATGVGSDEETSATGMPKTGKQVNVYVAYPSFVNYALGEKQIVSPTAWYKALEFDVTAVGDDMKLASISLNIDEDFAADVNWELRNGSEVVASGSDAEVGTLSVALNDPLELSDGDTTKLTLYIRATGTGSNKYFKATLEDVNGAVVWLVQDSEDVDQYVYSVADTLSGLPLEGADMYRE
jgi:hypothetical protein